MVGFLVTVLFFTYCHKKEVAAPELTVTPSEITLSAEGDTADLTISANAEWSTSTSSPWLQSSKLTGTNGSTTIQLMAMANGTGAARSTVLTVSAKNGQARRVTVTQPPTIYPSYNVSPKAPDATGMGSTAVQLAAKFKLGWNIGNTMEAPNNESGWGNPAITEDYIKFVKQQGFTAIRIPCQWDWHHIDNKATARIDPNWLNRVKEVVGYCVKNDMYVLLNIHWDGGWLDGNIKKSKQDSINAKQKAYWEQIATTMRDFDEHLMLASANEPPVENAEEMAILTSYHQTFINAVRSTGGRNSYRVLVVQGPSTDIEKSENLMNTLPVDNVQGRMMVEVHYYGPSQFCLLFDGDASWGKMFYYWGAPHHSTIEPDRNATWGEEDYVNTTFAKMKKKFADKGIPVILGEYGTYRRNNNAHVPKDLTTHNNAVDYWATYITKQAIANGMKPFWWDIGGALDRQNNTVKDQRTIDAIIAGSK
ncbi:glycoside hydrolase family 5 protein [Niastella caeni]|uniref:Glycoside hydrolase family 5 protein n=2 Tax=Niastella caeni TaxID=2569763 RepID=A0A4V4H1H4_9BACT|nr:glycoside hydrolase family 5 protein [Niastella caeni]